MLPSLPEREKLATRSNDVPCRSPRKLVGNFATLAVTISIGFQTAAKRVDWWGSERGVTSYRNVSSSEPI